MSAELNSLYQTLFFYKESLIKSLEKIDSQFKEAITHFSNSHHQNASIEKKKISNEMLAVLQTYVKLHHKCEELCQEVALKFAESQHEVEPERDTPQYNPFLSSCKNDNSDMVPTAIKTEPCSSFSRPNPNSFHLETEPNFSGITTTPNQSFVLQEQGKIQPLTVVDNQNLKHDESVENSNVLENNIGRRLESFKIDESKLSNWSFNSGDCGNCSKNVGTSTTNEETNVKPRSLLKVKNETIMDENPFKVTNGVKTKPLLDICSNHHSSLTEEEIDFQETEFFDSVLKEAEDVKGETDCSNSQRTGDFLTALINEPSTEEGFLKSRQVTFNLSPDRVQLPNRTQDVSYKISKKRNMVPKCDILRVGQVCKICHVVSPSEFYVRSDQTVFENFESDFTEAMNEQHLYVVNKFKSKEEAKQYFGNYGCGFLYNYRKWYRVEVLDWLEDFETDIRVQLIDYGVKAIWNYNSLKIMSENFAAMSKMAIQCHLAGVHSPNAKDKRNWPTSSIDFFTKCSESEFVAHFVSKEGDSYAVDLRKSQTPNSDSLGSLLVSKNLALEVKFTKDDDHIPSTTEKPSPQVSTIAVLPNPPPQRFLEVLIVGYISTCHFYAHLLNPRPSGGRFNDEFVHLRNVMRANLVVQGYEPFDVAPSVGELVLFRSGTDWFRGSCVKYSHGGEVVVFLKDYGYKIREKVCNLRKMKQEFLKVPFQAVECELFRCREKRMESNEASKMFFQTYMKMHVFKALVVESTKPLKLQLWNSEQEDIRTVLERNGLTE